MRRLLVVAPVACALATSAAFAQVYKCADVGHAVVYQDEPCPSGRELRNFVADPPTLSVLPMRPPGTTTRLTAPPPPAKPRAAAERKEKVRPGDPAERRYLHPGMHEGEVLTRVGPPDHKSGASGRKISRWTYMPNPRDPQTLTTVVFEYGKVIEVERKVMR